MERGWPCNCADLQPIAKIVERSFNCWEILRSLPDLYSSLYALGTRPSVVPGKIEETIVNYFAPIPLNAVNDSRPGESGLNRPLERTVDTHHIFVDRASDEEKKGLLALYERNPRIRVVDQFPNNLHLLLEVETKAGAKRETGYYPDVVDDLYGQKYFILDPDSYLPEPASVLILTYCLGMLSRYFPDVWMTVTDSRVEIAELTNTLLSIVQRKFPNLILDQMTGIKHYIHK
jgi:YaaC-like Protein